MRLCALLPIYQYSEIGAGCDRSWCVRQRRSPRERPSRSPATSPTPAAPQLRGAHRVFGTPPIARLCPRARSRRDRSVSRGRCRCPFLDRLPGKEDDLVARVDESLGGKPVLLPRLEKSLHEGDKAGMAVIGVRARQFGGRAHIYVRVQPRENRIDIPSRECVEPSANQLDVLLRHRLLPQSHGFERARAVEVLDEPGDLAATNVKQACSLG